MYKTQSGGIIWSYKGEAAARYKAAMSSARGRLHEEMIVGAVRAYSERGRAYIIKVPEPFRVLEKERSRAMARVRFTARAQPDFVGVTADGYGIAFEAKYTNSDRLQQKVITATQAEALSRFAACGGAAGVCAGIRDDYFMIPWKVFSRMKEIYGRLYVTAAEIDEYRVKFDGVIWFLDYANGTSFLPPAAGRKETI